MASIQDYANDPSQPTREEVELWVAMHLGDFREITDWSASLEIGDQTIDYPWESVDGECAYWDCMEPAVE